MAFSLPPLKSNEMAEGLSSKGWWLSKELVSDLICESLLSSAKEQAKMNRFKQARIGKGIKKRLVKDIRKDEIFWVEDWDGSAFKGYKEILDALIECLRRELFLPIKRFEGHLAHYRPNGFYIKHVDRHSVQPHRLMTCVLYLNDVPPGQGGELVLYKGDDILTVIQPQKGQLVLFDSATPHEVKSTAISRWSLTCWMRDDVL